MKDTAWRPSSIVSGGAAVLIAGVLLLSDGSCLDAQSDSLFHRQWHLYNPGLGGVGDTADISVLGVWNNTTKGDPSIVIAIAEINSIDFDHPDLVGNRWSSPEDPTEHGRDFSGRDSSDYCYSPLATDDLDSFVARCSVKASADSTNLHMHGTAVAGLAAAVGDSIGVTGVCQRCRFISLVLGQGALKTFAAALFYAVSNGARIINVSSDNPSLVFDQVGALADLWPDSVSIVISAGQAMPGSASTDICEELGLDTDLIIVGASDASDRLIPRSNFGPCLSILAPGGVDNRMLGITTTDVRGSNGYHNADASCPELGLNYTACFGGTSAAAPIVSGVIGLMLSVNRKLTRTQVKLILEKTADKIDHRIADYDDESRFSVRQGHGRVNAAAAVKCALDRVCLR